MLPPLPPAPARRFCDPSAFTDPAELREPLETPALEYLVEGEFRRDDRPADQGFFSKRWLPMERLLEGQSVARLDEAICAFESALERLREVKLSAAQSAAQRSDGPRTTDHPYPPIRSARAVGTQ